MQFSYVTIGILAHVDAGKTTLAESLLYKTGQIRKAGRVDHGDAFLDTQAMEKERGITIFSKQAVTALPDGKQVILMDTPGHTDFSSEMERTLQMLDYAILVISGSDGVQGHVLTLWKLLERYHIPTFLFVNKMDQPGNDAKVLLEQLKDRLSDSILRLEDSEACQEELAMCSEELMSRYLEGETIGREEIVQLIRSRQIFPCFFGSALKMEGIEELIEGLSQLTEYAVGTGELGARIFKISREGGKRLTWLRVTGGTLKAKMEIGGEKADEVRLYSGASWKVLPEAPAGMVCAVAGPQETRAGMSIGADEGMIQTSLEPVLTFHLRLSEGVDVHQAYLKLRQLEEEDPQLHMVWDADRNQIRVQLMGEVQKEIFCRMAKERFDLDIELDDGQIVYKETIAEPVEGVGHFEPLRHYAECHLLLEPGERGSGLTYKSAVGTDRLDLNWQRLIIGSLMECPQPGVLTGAALTDVSITVVDGRAHLKHTMGGDFREAACRAVRHGLMKTKSVLLEPVYRFRMEVPTENLGRAMNDIRSMRGEHDDPVMEGNTVVLTGTVPVAESRSYATQVSRYTHGFGHWICTPDGYAPCPEELAAQVVAECGYDPDTDREHPSGSVFCSHGAGVFIPWNEVEEHMHLPLMSDRQEKARQQDAGAVRQKVPTSWDNGAADAELMEIFYRTYGSPDADRSTVGWKKTRSFGTGAGSPGRSSHGVKKEEVLLVDGYNILFAWDELKDLAETNLDSARWKLADILANYRGYRKMTLILVFDAYKVSGGLGSSQMYQGIHIVYTKEAETADAYIEACAHRMAREFDVSVATSDSAEQVIIWGAGARRLSAKDLKEEIAHACREMQDRYLQEHPVGKRCLFDDLDRDLQVLLEQVRLGREEL
ncbi:MAG: TetM/TetW/TetO/TetS family tetracycline resistance ribosomal protection protein [Lachnospiraceae bacterium]|nr:TetM/TetW/TetO/TetS family tetracycline resistance ribosomal protection protein [Lachnospiraceae bacterium]